MSQEPLPSETLSKRPGFWMGALWFPVRVKPTWWQRLRARIQNGWVYEER
jgi:hypothetical protein